MVAAWVEGNSLRSTVRMTGVHRTTIQKLLESLGYACSACHAISLHYMFYNFCRVHQSLRITPAMAAGGLDRSEPGLGSR